MIYPNIVSHFCQKSIIDTNIHPQGFQELYNSSGYTFKNIDRINRRMFNCVFKTFKQKERYKQQSKGICRWNHRYPYIIDPVLDECVLFCKEDDKNRD